jgi:hypothetical protein
MLPPFPALEALPNQVPPVVAAMIHANLNPHRNLFQNFPWGPQPFVGGVRVTLEQWIITRARRLEGHTLIPTMIEYTRR